jgi:hypothetical protein
MANGMRVFNYGAINSDGLVIHGEVMAMDAEKLQTIIK